MLLRHVRPVLVHRRDPVAGERLAGREDVRQRHGGRPEGLAGTAARFELRLGGGLRVAQVLHLEGQPVEHVAHLPLRGVAEGEVDARIDHLVARVDGIVERLVVV